MARQKAAYLTYVRNLWYSFRIYSFIRSSNSAFRRKLRIKRHVSYFRIEYSDFPPTLYTETALIYTVKHRRSERSICIHLDAASLLKTKTLTSLQSWTTYCGVVCCLFSEIIRWYVSVTVPYRKSEISLFKLNRCYHYRAISGWRNKSGIIERQ